MEDKLSKELYLMNEKYVRLRNEYNSLFFKKCKKFFKLIKSGQVMYLINLTKEKINQKSIKNNTLEQKSDEKLDSKLQNYGKIAIYTCIIGNYDLPQEPVYVSDNCDYFIITDQNVSKTSTWKKLSLMNEKLKKMKENELNRYIKLHPHEFFPEYNWSIYIDGNVKIIADLSPMVESMGDCIIGIHVHSFRTCAYAEMKAFKYNSRLKTVYSAAKKQMKRYRDEGFPENYGLYENTIIVRKHNEPQCISVMNEWWKQLTNYTFRDQISLPYVVWKTHAKDGIKEFSYLKNNYRICMQGHQ